MMTEREAFFVIVIACAVVMAAISVVGVGLIKLVERIWRKRR